MTDNRESRDFIIDILAQINKIKKFTLGVTFEEFSNNDEKIYAVIHCLAIIGEAANKITKPVQRRYKNIKWREMTSMRNILIHYYYGANEKVIWKTIKNDIPELEKQVSTMLIDFPIEKQD